MTVKATMIGKLPDQDTNGLGSAAPHIEQNPHEVVTAVIRLKLRKTEYDQENGDITLKMGIEHLEVARGADEELALGIMRRSSENRTGLRGIDGFDDAGTMTVGAWEADGSSGEITGGGFDGEDDFAGDGESEPALLS